MGEQKNKGGGVGINTAEQRIPITGAKAYANVRLFIGGAFSVLWLPVDYKEEV